jgi:polar amino acid transport system substrate-binding protein
MKYLKAWMTGAAVVLTAGALAACGSSSTHTTAASGSTTGTSGASTTAATPGAMASVAKLVPASVKSKGLLTVAADATYAPDEFIAPDGHTVIGMDADLVKALAKVMGLKANVVNATFDTIIPGLQAGKYDLGASSFTDNKTREKVVDFVDYLVAGESFYTKAQGGTNIASIADICGKTVSVEKGTTEEADAGTQSKKCTSAGKPAVTVLSFSDQNQANLAVSSGRAQLGFADTPVAGYQVEKSNGQFKLVGASYANAPYGLALPKGNGMTRPVQAGLLVLQKDGQYAAILKKWGLSKGAIPASQMKINGATS